MRSAHGLGPSHRDRYPTKEILAGTDSMRNVLCSVIASLLCLCVVSPDSDDDKDAVLYLHLYSNRYDIHGMSSDLPPPPRDYQYLLTLALHPGKRLFASVPNHYEPEIEIDGVLTRRGDILTGDLTFAVQDVGIAYIHKHSRPVKISRFEAFDIDHDFKFVITESNIAPALPKPNARQEAGNNAVNRSRR